MDYLILIAILIVGFGIGYWIANRKNNNPPTSGFGGGSSANDKPTVDPQVK